MRYKSTLLRYTASIERPEATRQPRVIRFDRSVFSPQNTKIADVNLRRFSSPHPAEWLADRTTTPSSFSIHLVHHHHDRHVRRDDDETTTRRRRRLEATRLNISSPTSCTAAMRVMHRPGFLQKESEPPCPPTFLNVQPSSRQCDLPTITKSRYCTIPPSE